MKNFFTLFLLCVITSCSVTKKTTSMHPFSGGSVGCGNFIVYKLSVDNKELLSILVDDSAIKWDEKQTYSIGKSKIVKVIRKKYDGMIDEILCNDIMVESPKKILEEIATEGMVELIISEVDQKKSQKNESYKVTVILKNIIFETLSIDYLRFEDIYVGWLPG